MKRIYHHWNKWECFKAGFYDTTDPGGRDQVAAMEQYREFLKNIPRFKEAMERVLKEWPMSCEQFLSNESINRIAWLGQSAMCIETGVPSIFRGGFHLLSDDEKMAANAAAEEYLNKWLEKYRNT